jgi:hypothetical protein
MQTLLQDLRYATHRLIRNLGLTITTVVSLVLGIGATAAVFNLMDYDAMNHTGHDLPENVDTISLISTGFHDLGMPSIVGRGVSPSDAPDGQEPQPVVVLSYKFWQKHFFGDRAVLGADIAQLRGFTAPCEDSFQSWYGRCLQCSRCRQYREPPYPRQHGVHYEGRWSEVGA